MMKRFALALVLTLLMSASAFSADFGVYVKVMKGVEGSFDDAVTSIESALKTSGWNVLASYDSGVQQRCKGLRAHSIAIVSEAYDKDMMTLGPTAAFTVVMRIGVYQNSDGINVAMLNPRSINRTTVGDDTKPEISKSVADELADIIASAVKGSRVDEQIGQIRNEGKVGGMGGGDFVKKVKTIHSGGKLEDVASKVRAGIEANSKGWSLKYEHRPNDTTIIFGVTSAETEALAFNIAGEKRETSKDVCPGIDHAAAFPIEVVVFEQIGKANVVTLDEMYRMKLFFEDAGNWAFMKNMTMPGRIEDEIKDMSGAKLK